MDEEEIPDQPATDQPAEDLPRAPETSAPSSASRSVPIKVIVIVLLVALLAFGAYSLLKPRHHTVAGLISVRGAYANSLTGDKCSGQGGYDDMTEGTQVVVSDEKGAVIATGSLKAGTVEHSPERCLFLFTLQVPDASFYKFAISHRNPLEYSKDDMVKMHWILGLTLGG